MAITNGYTTLADFQSFVLPESGTNATDDTVIESIIQQVSREIDKFTNRQFYVTDEARYFRAVYSDVIYLPDFVSVSEVKTDTGDRTYTYTWASTDYDLVDYNTTPYYGIEVAPEGDYTFPTKLAKGVKITAEWGYCALANVPDDIVLACKLIAADVYDKRENPVGTGGTVYPSGLRIMPGGYPVQAKKLLEIYKV